MSDLSTEGNKAETPSGNTGWLPDKCQSRSQLPFPYTHRPTSNSLPWHFSYFLLTQRLCLSIIAELSTAQIWRSQKRSTGVAFSLFHPVRSRTTEPLR